MRLLSQPSIACFLLLAVLLVVCFSSARVHGSSVSHRRVVYTRHRTPNQYGDDLSPRKFARHRLGEKKAKSRPRVAASKSQQQYHSKRRRLTWPETTPFESLPTTSWWRLSYTTDSPLAMTRGATMRAALTLTAPESGKKPRRGAPRMLVVQTTPQTATTDEDDSDYGTPPPFPHFTKPSYLKSVYNRKSTRSMDQIKDVDRVYGRVHKASSYRLQTATFPTLLTTATDEPVPATSFYTETTHPDDTFFTEVRANTKPTALATATTTAALSRAQERISSIRPRIFGSKLDAQQLQVMQDAAYNSLIIAYNRNAAEQLTGGGAVGHARQRCHFASLASFFVPYKNHKADYLAPNGAREKSATSCASCVEGSQYSYAPVNPSFDVSEVDAVRELYVGRFSCATAEDLCVETTEGKLFRGYRFSPNDPNIELLPVPWCDERECYMVAVLATSHIHSNVGLVQPERADSLRLVRDQYKSSGARRRFDEYNYLRITGFSCNSCAERPAFCDDPIRFKA